MCPALKSGKPEEKYDQFINAIGNDRNLKEYLFDLLLNKPVLKDLLTNPSKYENGKVISLTFNTNESYNDKQIDEMIKGLVNFMNESYKGEYIASAERLETLEKSPGEKGHMFKFTIKEVK